MKNLKKLSLRKEELVSLNSPEMDSIKGGTGWLCQSVAGLTYDIIKGYISSVIESTESSGYWSDWYDRTYGSDGNYNGD